MSTESVPEPVRSISDDPGLHGNARMHGIRLGIFAVTEIAIRPLLPVLAVGWLLSRAGSAGRRAVSGPGPANPGDSLRRMQTDRRVVERWSNGADTPATE